MGWCNGWCGHVVGVTLYSRVMWGVGMGACGLCIPLRRGQCNLFTVDTIAVVAIALGFSILQKLCYTYAISKST